jgi:ribosomal protein S21
VFKCNNDVNGDFNYFANLNNRFHELFCQQLFPFFVKEVELAHFNPKIMPQIGIKIEIMYPCNVPWLLFFEKKIDRLIKGNDMEKAYLKYKKSCEEEGYNSFRNKTYGSRYLSATNKISRTKNKSHYRYYMIKDCVKNNPNIERISIKISTITHS